MMDDAFRAARARAMLVAMCRSSRSAALPEAKKRLREAMEAMPWSEEQATEWEYAKLEA